METNENSNSSFTTSDIIKIFDVDSVSSENDFLTKVQVLAVNNDNVVVRVTDKFTPVIPKNALKDIKDLQVGTTFDVFIEKKEDKNGQIVISRAKAEIVKKWKMLYDSLNKEIVIQGVIVDKLAGGLMVNINGISTFLPGSQIETKTIDNYDDYLGKNIDVIVTKINKKTQNVIVSHKLINEKQIKEQEKLLFEQIEKGQIVEGTVTSIVPYGAFVDVGGIIGLVYITDISWAHINNPNEVLQIGQKIKVVVLECDVKSQKLSLGLKHLTPSPWEKIESDKYTVGTVVNGKIVNIVDYGAFLELIPGVEGLIHISDLSWNIQTPKIDKIFKIGDNVKAKILDINLQEKKISLGIKQLSEDPWNSENIEEIMKEGTIHSCKVVEIKSFGCIVELENGIYGLLHENDLSWIQKKPKIDSFVKVNDKIDLIVLSFNKEERKISLGLKQKTENPWVVSKGIFEVGSTHEGTVIKKTTKGFFVQFENNLEGFVSKSHIPENVKLDIQSKSSFKVIEYDPDNCKMFVVHKDYKYDFKKQTKSDVPKMKKMTLGDTFKMEI